MIPVAECLCCSRRTLLHSNRRGTPIRCWLCPDRTPCCDGRMRKVAR
jgi:hypothetical protein